MLLQKVYIRRKPELKVGDLHLTVYWMLHIFKLGSRSIYTICIPFLLNIFNLVTLCLLYAHILALPWWTFPTWIHKVQSNPIRSERFPLWASLLTLVVSPFSVPVFRVKVFCKSSNSNVSSSCLLSNLLIPLLAESCVWFAGCGRNSAHICRYLTAPQWGRRPASHSQSEAGLEKQSLDEWGVYHEMHAA
jgi:hypothetical protein